jgi:hypothetical protein
MEQLMKNLEKKNINVEALLTSNEVIDSIRMFDSTV